MITELCAAVVRITEAAGQGPGHPGLDSAADGNHIYECMDWDQREKNGHSPSRTLAIEKDSTIPQLLTEYDM